MNYYNEIDPHAAAWLRELITAGLIPPGEVDERSITEVQPDDLVGFTQCHFFAGVAGWSLALHLAGWGADCPVWTASLPCQPFSVAGKRKGSKDERHLWPVFAELVRACKPTTILGEQVASADGRAWLAGIFTELEKMGYQRAGADLCAAGVGKKATSHGERLAAYVAERMGEVAGELFREWWLESGFYALYDCEPGAPHIRQRLYWVAHSLRAGRAEGWAEPGDRQVAGRCELGGLAHAGQSPAGRGLRGPGESVAAVGERPSDQLSGPGCLGGLAVADGDRDDTSGSRDASQIQGIHREAELSSWELGGAGDSLLPWDDCELVFCADGKARRTQRGLSPLAPRLSTGVVSSGDPSLQEVQATAEARVMRLKGFGNAIIPQLAAEFISAFLEAIEELHGY